MRTFQTTNPYSGESIKEYKTLTKDEQDEKLKLSSQAFKSWRKTELEYRIRLLKRVGEILRSRVDECAHQITLEMGKPLTESKAEVEKCAWVCDYYAKHAPDFLADDVIETEATHSFVRHDPLGTIFAVMPWNFPFWQVFRFAAPTLTSGNTGLLKHAPNVLGCAQKIEDIFLEAGYPEGVFQHLIIHHDDTERIISHSSVKAITLTGSEDAGAAVSQLASKYIKKSLLELGGSNAFIVLDDADLDLAVNTAINARMMNTGQSCIAAKRFILVESIYDEFVSRFIKGVSRLITGNPMSPETQIGPMARKDLADQLHEQMTTSVELGAELLLGGNQTNCFHEPTVLGEVTKAMPAFTEETFGPLAAMIKVKSAEEAIEYSEHSKFGLGVSLFTQDTKAALSYADHISDGALFINELVKSDPRLPFGGTKISGFGRELAKDGMMEFINRKTIYLK